jgi:hypothetical protein
MRFEGGWNRLSQVPPLTSSERSTAIHKPVSQNIKARHEDCKILCAMQDRQVQVSFGEGDVLPTMLEKG